MGVIRNLKRTALAFSAAILFAAAAAPAALAADAGKVNFDLNSTSKFDSLLTSSSPAQQAWMHDTYNRVRGYAPFFDQALSWNAPADSYRDLYAIYRDGAGDQALLAAHPDWVLRDASGRKLYIPCQCSNGSCTQYAADISNPGYRAWWINQARGDIANGYKGIFIDDVNMSMTVSDGNGDPVRPIDAATGEPMSDQAWSSYMADFTEQIRAALPNAEIIHNVPWFNPESDPYVQREVRAADTIELERGFNDGGITAGSGTFGYETLLNHIDWLHAQGVHFILEPYLSSAAGARYELANYLLTSDGSDSISSDYRATPDDFWRGWQTDLGAAQGERYLWHGLERRDFAAGSVLVSPPGSAKTVVSLPRSQGYTKHLGGQPLTRVAVKASRGVVLHAA